MEDRAMPMRVVSHKRRENLIAKYDVPGPRYTSYPAVPHWKYDEIPADLWKKELVKNFIRTNEKDGISLYIHLPFCEKLCTYCACNRVITTNHKVESEYLDALKKEWSIYLETLPEKPVIRELHLGGGTPTFFSPENLEDLLTFLFEGAIRPEECYYSFEAHPANTTEEHVRVLFNAGFRRLSLGVQDTNPVVQKAINREQTIGQVEDVMKFARSYGYSGINLDLIYGLPFQTEESIKKTISEVIRLKPERIAFYGYAHVPWTMRGQRGFSDEDIPAGPLKRKLFDAGKKLFLQAGYVEIGMDHFALPDDELAVALREKKLHRNFMGYTVTQTSVMIGLGVSAISDCWSGFAQNEKALANYYRRIKEGVLPVKKGHISDPEDLVIRRHILNIMCQGETSWKKKEEKFPGLATTLYNLTGPSDDGLVELKEDGLIVTRTGEAFLRNICMAFDRHLKNTPGNLFSRTV